MSGISIRPIRLVIADDHELLREGFHTMLTKTSHIELAGEASNGKELIELCRSLKPDVVITDIKMPVMDGVAATRILLAEMPALGIIAFSMFDEENLIVDMLEAGAQGYLLKSSSRMEILDAIRTVREGKTYYCSDTTARMASMIARSRHSPVAGSNRPDFTEKEIEVIQMICREMASKEIAASMNLSLRTVEGIRQRIQEKMGVRNAAGIVVYAIREGLFRV